MTSGVLLSGEAASGSVSQTSGAVLRWGRGGQLVKWAIAAVVVMLGLAYAANGVWGVHDDDIFELDRNGMNDLGDEPDDDWDNVFAGTDSEALASVFVADVYTDKEDIFDGGGSKDDLPISSWMHTIQNVQAKDNIVNSFAALYENDLDELVIYFGLDRWANNGAAQVGFWFLQDDVGPLPDGSFEGDHVFGDLLIQAEFTNGGAINRIEAFRWVGDGTGSDGNIDLIASGVDCDLLTAADDDFVCGVVNKVDTPVPSSPAGWDTFTPKFGTQGTWPVSSFFEAGVNVSQLVPGFDGCLTTFIAETRSSPSIDSTLSDFARGDLDSCGTIEAYKYLDANNNGAWDTGEVPLAGWEMTLRDSGGAIVETGITDSDGLVEFDAVVPGDYTVTETLQTDWVNTDPGDGSLTLPVSVGFSDTQTVDFGNVSPALSVTKECTSDVFVNGTIDYSIVVSNDGNVDLSVDVVDAQAGIDTTVDIAAGATAPFTPSVVATSPGTVENTVLVTSPDFPSIVLADDASCATEVHELVVTKDAVPAFDREYDWTIDKLVSTVGPDGPFVNAAELELFDGQSADVWWWFDATRSAPIDSAYRVSGTITVSNSAPIDATGVTVGDSLPGSTGLVVDCGGATTVPAAAGGVPGELLCTYSADLPDAATRTNTATATLNGVAYQGQTSVDFTGVEPTEVSDDTASYSDPRLGLSGAYSAAVVQAETLECDADEGLNVNTAIITEDDSLDIDVDDATVDLDCVTLAIAKTAVPSFDRAYDWTIDKLVSTAGPDGPFVDEADLELFLGESGDVWWKFEATRSDPIDSNFAVSGDITVSNPGSSPAADVSVADLLPGAVVDCGDGPGDALVTVPAAAGGVDGEASCSYTAPLADAGDGTNTATATFAGIVYQADEDFSFATIEPTIVTDESATYSDPRLGLSGAYSTAVVQAETLACDADAGPNVNTARITEDDTGQFAEDSATVDLSCVTLGLDKTVTPYFTRSYFYDITKEARLPADDGVINLNFGESYVITWDIVLSELIPEDSLWNIDTSVVVSNPSTTRDAVGVVVDDGLAEVSLTCDWAEPGTILAGGSVTCTATGDQVASTVLSNTATVTAYGVLHASDTATWTFDTPTTEVDKTVNVQDTFGPTDADLTNRLQPQPTTYTWGDAADGTQEWTLMTLVSSDSADLPDLLIGCYGTTVENDVAVFGDDDELLDSATATAPVDVACGTACTLTQGYWRTHSAAGPKGNHDAYVLDGTVWRHRDDTWDLLGDWDGDTLFEFEDELFFDSGMTWWEAQWTAPQGNVYYNLAHQWIAAHLNIWQEADESGQTFGQVVAGLPQEVQDAYQAAAAFFDGQDPDKTPRGKAKREINGWHSVLAGFNEGDFPGWPHCDENSEAEVTEFAIREGLF